jgi:hypothetical protein
MTDDKSGFNQTGGQPETISGTAKNAKAGAIVVAGDGSPTYVEGLSTWPEKLKNQEVTLTGIVRRKSIYPEVQEVDGVEIQGMTGIPRVIKLTEPLPEAD